MIVLFYIGLAFLLVGALFLISQIQSRSSSHKVPGVVVGFANLYGLQKTQINFNTVVSFYDLNGNISYAASTTGSSGPLNHVGEEIPVYIIKGNPDTAIVPSKAIFWIGTISFGIGLACLAFFIANFKLDGFSIGTSILITIGIIGSIWKRRKPMSTLDKGKWQELKSKKLTSKIYSESEKDQIPWIPLQQVQEVIEKSKKVLQISIPACALIGIGCAIASFAFYYQTQKFLKNSLPATGTVVDMATHWGKSTTYSPVIEFTRPQTSQSYRFRHPVGSSHPSYRIGDTVPVLYDPVHPEHARINAGKWNQAPSLLLAVISAMFIFITWSSIRSLEKYNYLKRRSASTIPRRSSRSA